MSVYDRAVRPTVKPIGSTGLHVGPGAYDVELKLDQVKTLIHMHCINLFLLRKDLNYSML